MDIIYYPETREFHLFNREISYWVDILENGQLGHLYFGKRIPEPSEKSHRYLADISDTPHATFLPVEPPLSLEFTLQEYPSYGTTDFRQPAFELLQPNGSRISDFEYRSHRIFSGKPKLEGLPATYTEDEREAETLEITLTDSLLCCDAVITYTIFRDYPAIARSVRFDNRGSEKLVLTRAMSMSIDFPDKNYRMLHLDGAWGRERYIQLHPLHQGIQSTSSARGCSSAESNPFFALLRPGTDERGGEVYGFSLVYSGNFLAQAEVDTYGTTRVMMGIHPQSFSWELCGGKSFLAPETVLVYTDAGLNRMSQIYHGLYRKRLARGFWRDRDRPILINNWEATGFDFDEESILRLARTASELGIEMLVLDDGWFGKRNTDSAGLGDWFANLKKIPDGIGGLSERIESLGLKFGLWFEPEMVNKDSDFYRAHPDWILSAPGRLTSAGRNQYVLDFSNAEVVRALYEMMAAVLRGAHISYIKWDMNRHITECFSRCGGAAQGEIFHRYVLGVYSLYERLTREFPHILFEGCASGGARFDPGMLFYAPQSWTSDDTDAAERLKIQYGTSLVYPLSSIGSHVSAVPNQQVGRVTPLTSRASVSFFGTFGYELDLNALTSPEKEAVKKQIALFKVHRGLIRNGLFYRLKSPFTGNDCSWMVVSEDGSEAIVGYYRLLCEANVAFTRVRLLGLAEDGVYEVSARSGETFTGAELMYAGLMIRPGELCGGGYDFSSVLYHIKKRPCVL